MKKILVLAEKPSVARDIARVLNCHQKGNGYIEGSKYIVTWALGHLVTLADPEQYEDRYQQWRLEDLPILPPHMELRVIPQTSKQFSTVKSLMNRNDVEEIVIGTDAGREGELVARWIIEKANTRKPLKRLWISSVTDKAIRDGFQNLKDGSLYYSLYESAESRSIADWVVGINATRALTTKYNAQLSCGRVQTPTLAVIAKREEEIRLFKPRSYYGIKATTKDLTLTWQDYKTKETRSFDEQKIEQIMKPLHNQKAEVTFVNKQQKRTFAPQLFDLTELQREANRFFQYSPKQTLQIMQSLYEHHKLVTYPRTDSRYLTQDLVSTLKDRLSAVSFGHYKPFVAKLRQLPLKGNLPFINDAKVGDHHAIIPTEEPGSFLKLNDQERKIYDLIVKRFIAVLMPPFTYLQVTVEAKIGNELFTAKGKVIESLGWKEVYQNNDYDDNDDDQTLPDLIKGDILAVNSVQKTRGETKPPAYFTEATLLTVMENPKQYMETTNQALLKMIGESGGLGTVATRADIIEKLFNTALIEKKGNFLFSTSKGKQLLDLVPEAIKSPILTAKWEQQLSLIANKQLRKEQFLSEMKEFAISNVNEIKNSKEKFKHDNLSGKSCPDCGKILLEINNRNNKFLACQDRSCGYRKNISQLSNARCPKCHKKLELFGEGDAKIFVCKCGHKEKMATFQQRKKEEGKQLSNKEARQYLNKNEKEVPMNNALADALKDLLKK